MEMAHKAPPGYKLMAIMAEPTVIKQKPGQSEKPSRKIQPVIIITAPATVLLTKYEPNVRCAVINELPVLTL